MRNVQIKFEHSEVGGGKGLITTIDLIHSYQMDPATHREFKLRKVEKPGVINVSRSHGEQAHALNIGTVRGLNVMGGVG